MIARFVAMLEERFGIPPEKSHSVAAELLRTLGIDTWAPAPALGARRKNAQREPRAPATGATANGCRRMIAEARRATTPARRPGAPRDGPPSRAPRMAAISKTPQ